MREPAPESRLALPSFAAGRMIYPLHERLMKRPTFPYLRELERTQWLSRPELERYQLDKLGRLLRSAAAHCPWYRERIEAAEIPLERDLTLDDLRRLPTLTKADAKANRERMVWHGVPGGAQRYNPGGSSGEPLIFYFGRRRQASSATIAASPIVSTSVYSRIIVS